MGKHILFMPDGNRRYAKIENISQEQAYQKGTKSLQLFSDFFLLENDWSQLTMHFMSKYTHERNDGSLNPIYNAMINEFTYLYDTKYFDKNDIKFQWLDHSNKLPVDIVEICQALEEQTKKGAKISLNLLGYDLETDERNAFNQARSYDEFKANRLISDIDLVVRTTEMRPSKGPVYAMAQSQMLLLQKLNPELERTDLERMLQEYNNLVGYRQTTNPIHK
jgi:tritrans,polycis-undecaprenyl-diphosphate synthase [geranylgeranyl-diphosphate specific]